MAQLSTLIKIYAKENGVDTIDYTSDVLLQDDMEGGVSKPYIKEWNLDIPKPDDLSEYEAEAKKEEANQLVIAKRVSLYGSAIDQIQILVEQGVDALVERNLKIKSDNPKE
tara:strand:+ start:1029 stop:1361 length:333 start_codon:yes stop_codon:yes gene_type:complete